VRNDADKPTPMYRKYAICDTPNNWTPERRYWNAKNREWGNLDNATLYDKQLPDLPMTVVWTDEA
jgi:hypothetical protein